MELIEVSVWGWRNADCLADRRIRYLLRMSTMDNQPGRPWRHGPEPEDHRASRIARAGPGLALPHVCPHGPESLNESHHFGAAENGHVRRPHDSSPARVLLQVEAHQHRF